MKTEKDFDVKKANRKILLARLKSNGYDEGDNYGWHSDINNLVDYIESRISPLDDLTACLNYVDALTEKKKRRNEVISKIVKECDKLCMFNRIFDKPFDKRLADIENELETCEPDQEIALVNLYEEVMTEKIAYMVAKTIRKEWI